MLELECRDLKIEVFFKHLQLRFSALACQQLRRVWSSFLFSATTIDYL